MSNYRDATSVDLPLTCISDAQGNKLHLVNGSLYLLINGETKKIGTISTDKETGKKVLVKKCNTNHIFRKNDSWGINLNSLNFLGNDDIVRITYSQESETYELTKKQLLEKGDFLWFKEIGFEKQIFVPRRNWNITKSQKIGKGSLF